MKTEVHDPIHGIEKFIDIGMHRLRVILSDLPSEVTIVLEAGGGKDADSYQAVQGELARLTGMRVMSYDRSGFGRSELGPAHFNAVDEMQALHRCLEIQGFAKKLILVGLSYGGYLIQLFAALHPELVSGLVLIDPMHVWYVDHIGLETLNAMMLYFGYYAAGALLDHARLAWSAAKRGILPILLISLDVVVNGFGEELAFRAYWQRLLVYQRVS